MTEKKKMEVIFAPGCFDNFEGTQEELDEMMAEIHKMIESGEMFEKSRPLSEEEFLELPESIQDQLEGALLQLDDKDVPNRKLH